MSGSCSLKMLKLNVTSPTVSVQRVTVPLQVQVRAQCNHCDLSKRILPPERRKNWGSVQNFNPMYCRRSQNMCKQWHHSPRPEFSKREPTPQCGESGCQEMDCWSKSINLLIQDRKKVQQFCQMDSKPKLTVIVAVSPTRKSVSQKEMPPSQ